jgi:hypothetical protein
VLGLDAFQFDGNFFARNDVCAQIDVTETAAPDLSTDAVLVADSEILLKQGSAHFSLNRIENVE